MPTPLRSLGFAGCLALAMLAGSLPASTQPTRIQPKRGVSFDQIKLGLAHVGLATPQGEQVAIQWLGSGFVVDRDCTVVTAKHALASVNREQLIVRLLHPTDPDAVRTFKTRVVYEDPDSDIIFLRFGNNRYSKQFCRTEVRPLPLIATFDRHLLSGREVRVAGFPVLEGEQPRDLPIVRRGIVASSEFEWEGRAMLLLDLTGVPGFSGGPVILEESGQVIGIVFGPGRTQRQYDLEWATPISRAEYLRGIAEDAPAAGSP